MSWIHKIASYARCIITTARSTNWSSRESKIHLHQQKLRERLERLPFSAPPSPWVLTGHSIIGGLTEVGFAPETDDLLVVSSFGRGLFDCLTGERIARDPEEDFRKPGDSELAALGIGKYSSQSFKLSGLHGGGLDLVSKDGWTLDVVQLPWPIHILFLSSGYGGVTGRLENITKVCSDEPCSYRAAGFSPTGRSFIMATSGELIIYSRTHI